MGRELTLTIDYDSIDFDDLLNDWKVIPFNRKWRNYEDPSKYIKSVNKFGEAIPANIGIARKLDCQTAFFLSCYQHSGVAWSLLGDGMQCPWDSTKHAGILMLSPNIPKDKRVEAAQSVLEEYNAFCNGEVYWYSLEDSDGNDVSSCTGFLGLDSLGQGIREILSEGDFIGEVRGGAKCLAEYLDLPMKKKEAV